MNDTGNLPDPGAECINLATRRRDGRPVRTPVWFIVVEDAVYLRTVDDSAKVRRIRYNPAVEFAACNWDGDLSGPWCRGSATLLAGNDPLLPAVDEAMDRKYGERRREMTALMTANEQALVYIKIHTVEEKR